MPQNVDKVVKDFEDAIASDHVRKADEVRMLIKCLKGDAKKTIGDHHKSLEAALDQLRDNYGSPRLIVDRYLKEFERQLGHILLSGENKSTKIKKYKMLVLGTSTVSENIVFCEPVPLNVSMTWICCM